MDQNIVPAEHPDPWVNLLHGYMTELVQALNGQGARIRRSWLDPCGPRDATVVYASASRAGESRALVWDEVTGCRSGRFISGRPGVRTELADVIHLGGGVLLEPAEAAVRLATGTTAPRREFRSYTEVRDGLDDALRRYCG